MNRKILFHHTVAFLFFSLFTTLLTWPLVTQLSSSILGGGDSYLVLWDFWWMLRGGGWDCNALVHPWGVNLVQHDLPLFPYVFAWLANQAGGNLILSSNITTLIGIVLNGFAAYFATYHSMKNRSFTASLAAGLIFGFSAILWLQVHGHLGLLHAYALPLIVWLLSETWARKKPAWSLALGFALVLATLCHYYLGVYGFTYVAFFLIKNWVNIHISIEKRKPSWLLVRRGFWILGTLGFMSALIIWFSGGGTFERWGLKIRLSSTANPMMIWWISWSLALILSYKIHFQSRWIGIKAIASSLKPLMWAGAPLVLLTPLVMEIGKLVLSGDFGTQSVGWKSGPKGGFFFSLFFTNSQHWLWATTLSEDVALNLGWTALFVVISKKVWKQHPILFSSFLFFTLMSLGPFLRLWPGMDNGPVLPFWFFRYVPVVSGARIPMRWFILAIALWSFLVAYGIGSLRTQRARVFCLIGLCLESFLSPLKIMQTHIPPVYDLLRVSPADGTGVLELPFGIRDGVRGWGQDYDAVRLYYQTHHEKPVLGAYLGRLPKRLFETCKKDPILQTLVHLQNPLSENTPSGLTPSAFLNWLQEWKISWVVLEKENASPRLVEQISTTMGLPLYEDATHLCWKTPHF